MSTVLPPLSAGLAPGGCRPRCRSENSHLFFGTMSVAPSPADVESAPSLGSQTSTRRRLSLQNLEEHNRSLRNKPFETTTAVTPYDEEQEPAPPDVDKQDNDPEHGQPVPLDDLRSASDLTEQDGFKDDAYLRIGGVAYVIFGLATVAWCALVAVAPRLAGLSDPTFAALSIVVAFVLFAGSASRRVAWSSTYAHMLCSVLPLLTVMHAAFASFLVHASVAGGLSALRAVAMYVSLVAVFGQAMWSSRAPSLVAKLRGEVAELRTQGYHMRVLLARAAGGGDDDEEELSELEGDEREHAIVPPTLTELASSSVGLPEKSLPEALNGQRFDHALALKIATRLRRPAYSLAHFYDDVRKAFPELELYCVCTATAAAGDSDDEGAAGAAALGGMRPGTKSATTSGLSWDAEYRRTIGALFAVYWLMRIGIDGERGFSFGVDDEWKPREAPVLGASRNDADAAWASLSSTADDKAEAARRAELAKRLAFYQHQDWARLRTLLADSGMIEVDANGEVHVHAERTVAMLALTAFHDIMKVEALLPQVAAAHAPFHGYQEGDVIGDHDIALGYVLEHHPHVLPSFVSLDEANKRSIRFTQSKMSFNHGWLVQGEAPPAPLFAKFKQVMLSEHVAPQDVAFYFVHWLTDLAGAEPSPLGGGEKFVLKFPHAVLDSFIRSFAVLNELAVKSETQVMEEYLVRTWQELPGSGPLPRGEDSIARLRLFLQAQTPDKQQAVMQALDDLSGPDKAILTDELARTGIENQVFSRGPSWKQAFGPAFLVYYSPAFVRSLAPVDAYSALQILAEVYRRARALWPLRPTTGNAHAVTLRIDQLKELKLSSILKVRASPIGPAGLIHLLSFVRPCSG